MHRVELKVKYFRNCCNILCLFLMHRVELKALVRLSLHLLPLPFLMHRVELKAKLPRIRLYLLVLRVPNAPCGVERNKVEARMEMRLESS